MNALLPRAIACVAASAALAATGASGLGLLPLALFLAAFLVVPVGLSVARETRRGTLWAAIALAASFFVEPGPAAGALALPWLAVAGLAALRGLRRVPASLGDTSDLATTAGLVFWSAGAAWAAFHRFDLQPLGFVPPIVVLTAIHFHFAGFAASVLSGAVSKAGGIAGTWANLAMIAGTPLVAAGITASPLAEVIGAGVLASGVFSIAGVEVFLLAPRAPNPQRLLLRVSGGSAAIGMTLAIVFAAGEYAEVFTLGIPRMAAAHGTINALGFALAGLLALAPR